MNIAGECKVCGHLYDVTTTVGCPACRAARVAEAFKPIDPLRTAMGAGYEFMRGKRYAGLAYGSVAKYMTSLDLAEVPKGCKMPTDEAGQVWELKRLFRL